MFLAGILILIIAGLVACGNSTPPAQVSDSSLPAEISVQDAVTQRERGAFILDVREQSEWNEFHVPDSTLIPLGQLQARVNEAPKDKPIVVVCRSGNRSKTGRDILTQAGFTNVTSMNGGVTEWRSAGYPIVSGP